MGCVLLHHATHSARMSTRQAGRLSCFTMDIDNQDRPGRHRHVRWRRACASLCRSAARRHQPAARTRRTGRLGARFGANQVPTGRGGRAHGKVRPPRPAELQAMDGPRAQSLRRPEAVAGYPARVSRPRCHGRGHARPAARGGDPRRAQGRRPCHHREADVPGHRGGRPDHRVGARQGAHCRSGHAQALRPRPSAHSRGDQAAHRRPALRHGVPGGTAARLDPHVQVGGAERPVQLRRHALGGFDLPLLPEQARLAHRRRPEEAAGARRHQRLRRRAGAGGLRRTG